VVDEANAFKQVAGLAIGFTITFGTLMAAGLTGAAMNPARAFGPELVANDWTDFWVWYVGPFAGGVIAAVVYELLSLHRPTAARRVEPPAETPLEEPTPGTAAID
jgi:glycerol uptake facilitator-like aquaporin